MNWWHWRRWVLGAGLGAIALVFAITGQAHGSANRPYAASFKAAWNHADPRAPILKIACLPTTRIAVGMRGNGAIEDCLIVERTPLKGQPDAEVCTGVYLDVRFKDPLNAVEDAVLVSCAQAKKEIAAVDPPRAKKSGFVA